MNEENDFALVPRPPGALEKAEPGEKRVLVCMVQDALMLARARVQAQIIPSLPSYTSDELENWFQKGRSHYYGTGVPTDYSEAAKWFRNAAERGHARAQYQLSLCYEYGRGVPQDYTEAEQWFRKSADGGYAEAQSDLGRRYHYGLGVPQDYAESVKWYRKAAEQGLAEAQLKLADRYLDGVGVAHDIGEAEKWLLRVAENEKATEQILAQLSLGVLYEDGIHVALDITKAVMWYRKAAEALSREEFPFDCGFAASNLARMYTCTLGVQKDFAKAYMWLKFGARIADDKDAEPELTSLCAQMSPDELIEGEKRYERLKQQRKEQFGES
jgi:TPR repeat protein